MQNTLRLLKNAEHKQVGIYCRVSSDKQAREATIESQLAEVKAYCLEQGYQLEDDNIFLDEGYSGSTLERPGLDKLRDNALLGILDTVTILCPDRLARKSTHQLLLSEEFKKLGIELEFVNRQLGDNAEDRLLFSMQGVIAEFEREKIIERTRRGKIFKAKNGQISVLSRAPYGYKYLPKKNNYDASYEVIQDEAEIVKLIYSLFLEKNLSLRAIAKTLQERGIKNHSGNLRWSTTSVWGVLKNPVYSGNAAYGKYRAVERKRITKQARDNSFYPKTPKSSRETTDEKTWIYLSVPSIVSEEIFEQAKIKLQQNKKLSPRSRKKNRYLVAGMARCEICDYAIIGSCSHRPPGNDHFYYRCQGIDAHRFVDKKKVCAGRPMRCEVLDDIVWEQVKKLIQEPTLVLKEYKARFDSQNKKLSDSDGETRKKEKLIRQYDTEKKRLIKLYQTGVISIKEIEDNLQTLRASIKKTKNEIKLILNEKEQSGKFLQLINKFADFTKNFAQDLDSLTFAQKQNVIRLLVDDIVVNSITGNVKIRHVVPEQKSCFLRSGSLTDLSCPTHNKRFALFTRSP